MCLLPKCHRQNFKLAATSLRSAGRSCAGRGLLGAPSRLCRYHPAFRLHLAGKDELTPSRYCETLVSKLRTQGVDISATVYAEAHHAFDLRAPVQYFSARNNFADCSFDLRSVDAVLTQQELQRCAKKGTSLGGNPREFARFQENMLAELQSMLK